MGQMILPSKIITSTNSYALLCILHCATSFDTPEMHALILTLPLLALATPIQGAPGETQAILDIEYRAGFKVDSPLVRAKEPRRKHVALNLA